MYTEKQIKAKAKEFYTFCNKYVNKPQTSKIEIYPGITATVKYDLYIDDCIDINSIDVKLSKEMKVLESALQLDFATIIHNMDLDDKIDVSNLDDEYRELLDELNSMIYGDDSDEYESYLRDYTEGTLTNFYESVMDIVEDQKETAKEKLLEKKVKLTDDYVAIINKPHGRIHVGCQRIPIEKVRELVKLYDEA